HLVVDLGVEDLGHEVRAEALDLVRTRLAAVEDRRLGGLDRDDLHARLALLEHLPHTRDGPARADARDEDVDLAVGVLPDLLGRRRAVDRGVRLVRELPREDRARALGGDALGGLDRATHTLRAGGQDELGTVGTQESPALLRHRLGHRQDDLVAARGTHEGERDPGVAARRLDDRPAWGQLAGGLRGVDDRDTDAVLDRARRVVELELRGDRRADALRESVDAHERRAADELGGVVVDAGHGLPSGGTAGQAEGADRVKRGRTWFVPGRLGRALVGLREGGVGPALYRQQGQQATAQAAGTATATTAVARTALLVLPGRRGGAGRSPAGDGATVPGGEHEVQGVVRGAGPAQADRQVDAEPPVAVPLEGEVEGAVLGELVAQRGRGPSRCAQARRRR